MKSWLQDNDIELYSVGNEGKSLVGAGLIGTLNNEFTNT